MGAWLMLAAAPKRKGKVHAQHTHTHTHTLHIIQTVAERSWRRSWGTSGALLADSKANGNLANAS